MNLIGNFLLLFIAKIKPAAGKQQKSKYKYFVICMHVEIDIRY